MIAEIYESYTYDSRNAAGVYLLCMVEWRYQSTPDDNNDVVKTDHLPIYSSFNIIQYILIRFGIVFSLNFFSEIISELQKNWKDKTDFPYTLHSTSP